MLQSSSSSSGSSSGSDSGMYPGDSVVGEAPQPVGHRPLDRNFVPKQRVVWLDVKGVPVRVSIKSSFRKILAKWGDIVVMKDELGENIFINRVGVLTEVTSLIFDVVKVKVDGTIFSVRIKEVVGWNPTFAPDTITSESEEEVEYKDGIYDDDGNSPHFSDGEDGDLLETNRTTLEDDDNTKDHSSDPFGIYDTMARMDKNEGLKKDDENTEDAGSGVGNDYDKTFPYEDEVVSNKNADVGNDINQYTEVDLRQSRADAGIVHLEHHSETPVVETTSAETVVEPIHTVVIDKVTGDVPKSVGADIPPIQGDDHDDESLSHLPGYTPKPSGNIEEIRDSFSKDDPSSSYEYDATIEMGTLLGFNMDGSKKRLWNALLWLTVEAKGDVIFIGDFNEVRTECEHFGSQFCRSAADVFNWFICEADLVDLPLGGPVFTSSNRRGSKMSKLDRFLLSLCILGCLPGLSALVLEKKEPDHRPIFLRENILDYGVSLFRTFHSWFRLEGFDDLVKSTWLQHANFGSHPMVHFKKKLQFLKTKIKGCVAERISSQSAREYALQHEIDLIDLQILNGEVTEADTDSHISSLKELRELEHMVNLDVVQKAKVRWGIEGDENSNASSTSTLILAKACGLSIPAVPLLFSATSPGLSCLDLCPTDLGSITDEHHIGRSMHKNCAVTRFKQREIKRAVWDSGSEKTLGPDGFTFGFIKHYWDFMAGDVFSLVEHFYHDPLIPSGCNPLFITLILKVNDPKVVKDFRPISLIGCQAKIIGQLLANRVAEVVYPVVGSEQYAFIKGRQILDGPLMLNEIVGWSKAKKRQLMVFKVDFEKAYDSVSWDYLFEVIGFMGFGDRWCSWIRGLLCSAKALVLVNGSPTEEFIVRRGLRQGDQLSPFLFILIMEGLHIAFKRAKELNAFTGFRIGGGGTEVSHFFYADDAVFLCDWSLENVRRILRILRCFFLASRLKINLLKNKLIGIGVSFIQVEQLAGVIGCGASKTLFIYLGLPVGQVMSRIQAWKSIKDKFYLKLTRWKAKSLSIGGRLTLIMSVLGSIGSYFMSLFPVPVTVLRDLEGVRARFFGGWI
ncbi:putative RNA-directed DNA polymerase, eukaryota, reverse transcriptase zinc-binding domain protein [Tanacetum coccineum]